MNRPEVMELKLQPPNDIIWF